MSEKIFDVYWEGPFDWKEFKKDWDDPKNKNNKSYVLYAIFGTHPVHGHDSLLYIGKTKDIRKRVAAHEEWMEEEHDAVKIRIASMGKISTWEDWDKIERYRPAKIDDVSKVEALLIFSHHPVYNQRNKYGMDSKRHPDLQHGKNRKAIA